MKAITKAAKPLPSRSELSQLVQSGKTINDYSKATPLVIPTDSPVLMQNLRRGANGVRR